MASKPLGESGWSVNKREFLWGVVLILLSFSVIPLLFNIQSFHVMMHLHRALIEQDIAELLTAAMYLVLLNTIRATPHYVGAFFISESLEPRSQRVPKGVLNLLFTFILLELTYKGIELLHHIRYDFGIPAVFVGLFAVLFGTLNYRHLSLLKKAMMIAVALLPLQFLDVVPALRFLPVGRGETSTDVKLSASVLGVERMLNVFGTFGMLLFFAFALLLLKQLRDENVLRELALLREQNEEIRTQARISEIRSRTYEEVQYLVHDLKSPLTAIQTMVDVIKLEQEMNGEARDAEYLTRIENSVEQISNMVSEILNEDRRFPVGTQKLLDSALAQTSVTAYAPCIHTENRAPEDQVCVNRVLFSRVLVNLLQNAAQAVPEGRTPEIRLCVDRKDTPEGVRVLFSVSDNGKGIPKNERESIWTRGVSGKGSSGIGLAFVRNVVERMEGEITLDSTVGKGTVITISLQGEGEYE